MSSSANVSQVDLDRFTNKVQSDKRNFKLFIKVEISFQQLQVKMRFMGRAFHTFNQQALQSMLK